MKKTIGLCMSILMTLTLAACTSDTLELKKDNFTVEYGEKVSTKATDYLRTEDKNILKKTKISISDLKKDKEYVKIGKYKAKATYDKKTVDFTIEVKDSKAPVFKDILKEIIIEQNAEDVDFVKFFKAEDMSDVKITVDSKKVDVASIGNYEIKVTAQDTHKNKVTKIVKVKVVSMEEAVKEKGITKTLDGITFQSKAMKEKIQAENEKEGEEKQEQNNNTSNGNTSNSSGGNANNGNTNSGSTSNGGTVEPSKPNVCASDGNFGRVGNSGKVFFSKKEADKYADDLIVNQVEWIYEGYTAFTVYDNCGERNDVWTVNFY